MCLIIWLSLPEMKKQAQETKTERKDVFWHWKVNILVVYILTDYEAAFRANHVPCTVVLHQYGIRVVGTLNSGKGQSISATEEKQKWGDPTAQKARKRCGKGEKIKTGKHGISCWGQETKKWGTKILTLKLDSDHIWVFCFKQYNYQILDIWRWTNWLID